LSQQIRRLESEFGVELFVRDRRGVALTQAGGLLLERSVPLLAEAQRIEELMARAATGEVGRLALGFVRTASFRTMPAILRRFRERHPDVETTLEELASEPQAEALRAGRIDVGFVRPPVQDRGIELTDLVAERLVAVLPDTHPLAQRGSVPVAALAGEPFVLMPQRVGGPFVADVLDVCRRAGFTPGIVQDANEMQTIVGLVSGRIGVSLVPESVQTLQMPGAVYRPLTGPNVALRLALAVRSGERSPLVEHFRAIALGAGGDA
jgi:DNA-binding transcriptional LysR family regulator